MSSTQEVGDIFGPGAGPANAMLRAPTVLIVAVGLWGMNIFFFRLFGINYKFVLQYDLLKEEHELSLLSSSATVTGGTIGATVATVSTASTTSSTLTPPGESANAAANNTNTMNAPSSSASANLFLDLLLDENDDFDEYGNGNPMESHFHKSSGAEITWFKLVMFSVILLFLLHGTTHFWIDILGRGVVGAVFCFYLAVLVYIFIPLSSNQWLRRAFWITLQRTGALIYPRCWYCRTSSSTSSSTTTTSLKKRRPPPTLGGSSTGNTGNSSNGTSTTGSSEVLLLSPRPIPFIDVFYADAMCSLSKVFFDWGMLIHAAYHYPQPLSQDVHSIIMPSIFATIPFVIRARQCLLMFSIGRLRNDHNRYHHLANAVKYSTSIWPLLLSAYQKTMLDPVQAQNLDIYLIILQTINALYALYWDIVMDWGMMQNPQAVVAHACVATTSFGYDPLPMKTLANNTNAGGVEHGLPHHRNYYRPNTTSSGGGNNNNNIISGSKTTDNLILGPSALSSSILPTINNSNNNSRHHRGYSLLQQQQQSCHHLLLRPRLRFGLTMSALIVLADSVLRFSWLLRFVSNRLFVSHDAFVLCTQFLEVFRRAIWNLLRVEWENIKQQQLKNKVAGTNKYQQQQQRRRRLLKARDSLSDTEGDDFEMTTTMDELLFPMLPTSTMESTIISTKTSNNTTATAAAATAGGIEQEMVKLLSSRSSSIG